MHRLILIALAAGATSITAACHTTPPTDPSAAASPADQAATIEALEQALETYKQRLASTEALLKSYQDQIIILPPITIDPSYNLPPESIFTDLNRWIEIQVQDPARPSQEPH